EEAAALQATPLPLRFSRETMHVMSANYTGRPLAQAVPHEFPGLAAAEQLAALPRTYLEADEFDDLRVGARRYAEQLQEAGAVGGRVGGPHGLCPGRPLRARGPGPAGSPPGRAGAASGPEKATGLAGALAAMAALPAGRVMLVLVGGDPMVFGAYGLLRAHHEDM